MDSSELKDAAKPALALILTSSSYILLESIIIHAYTSGGRPDYLAETPVRVFFAFMLASAAIITLASTKTGLKKWFGSAGMMATGLLFSLTGLAGMLLVESKTSPSNTGGLAPDLGHILTPAGMPASLALYFCLTGWMPYILGYRMKKEKNLMENAGLTFSLLVAAYYLGFFMVKAGLFITA